jgi:hypothetical protein
MGALVSDAERQYRAEPSPTWIPGVWRLLAQTGQLNVRIAGLAVATPVGGIISSGRVFELADRWRRALTVTLASVGMGG